MKKYMGIVAVLLFAGSYSMQSNSKTDLTQLATCLTTKGWVMYEAAGCKACQKQRKAFGSAFVKIKTVECNDSSPKAEIKKCTAQNIRYTPTWILIKNGKTTQRLVGYQSLEKLAKVSGCG